LDICIPNAVQVADLFHLVKLALSKMDECRRRRYPKEFRRYVAALSTAGLQEGLRTKPAFRWETTTAAIALLWHAITRDAAGVDWKCAVSAGVWRQLESFLLPEVSKWARCLRWDVIGRPPFDRHELLKLNLTLRFGSAFAVASDVPALIEGVHADSLLYILDEAKEIPAGTFDAVEGAFAGEGEAMGLASSTPGQPTGRFFDIQTQKP
jgi:hypothetical protein